MKCPYCNTENREDRETCYQCNKDISMLRLLVNKARYHYNAALEHAERGRNSEAIAELNNALDLDAGLSQARVVLGTIYARVQDLEKARETWLSLFKRDHSLEKAYTYLGKLETVKESQPVRKWLRISVAAAGVFGVVSLVLLVLYALPIAGLNTLSSAIGNYSKRDLAAFEADLNTLDAQRSSIAPEILTSYKHMQSLVGREMEDVSQAISDALRRGDFGQARYHLDQAALVKWPAEMEKRLEEEHAGFERALETKIAELTESGLLEARPDGIRRTQFELAKLATMSDAKAIVDRTNSEIERLDKHFAEVSQREKVERAGLANISPLQVSQLIGLLADEKYDEAARVAQGLHLSEVLPKDLYDGVRAALDRFKTRSAAAMAANAEPSADRQLLASWFVANQPRLVGAEVPATLQRMAKLNAGELAELAPQSAETLFARALAEAAQGKWDAAQEAARTLRANFPEFKRPADFDEVFSL